MIWFQRLSTFPKPTFDSFANPKSKQLRSFVCSRNQWNIYFWGWVSFFSAYLMKSKNILLDGKHTLTHEFICTNDLNSWTSLLNMSANTNTYSHSAKINRNVNSLSANGKMRSSFILFHLCFFFSILLIRLKEFDFFPLLVMVTKILICVWKYIALYRKFGMQKKIPKFHTYEQTEEKMEQGEQNQQTKLTP